MHSWLDPANSLRSVRTKPSRSRVHRVLREDLLALAAGRPVWMNGYSLGQFGPETGDLRTAEDCLDRAGKGELCFVETTDPAPWLERMEGLVLYRWNRDQQAVHAADEPRAHGPCHGLAGVGGHLGLIREAVQAGTAKPEKPAEKPPETQQPSTPDLGNVTLPFVDVGSQDWFYEAVRFVYARGMMSGTAENQFSPQQTTTRGMIVTILHRLEGTPDAGAGTHAMASRA